MTDTAVRLDDRQTADVKPSVVDRSLDFIDATYTKLEGWLFRDKRALYGSSLARILSGCAVLGILTTNFRVRNVMFGQGSVWNKPLQDIGQYAPPRLVENLGNTAFLFYYLAAMFIAVLFILGWHTRLVGPLMLIGHVSIIERMPILGDQGDNILRIGLFLLLFMHTNEHWSLDARRRSRTESQPVVRGGGAGNVLAVVRNLWNSHFVLPRWLSNGVHNIVLSALAFQVILVYFSAGLFKVQGVLWQRGTALYYPLQLQEYKPFPFLTDAFTYFGVIVGLSTYIAVLVQIGFSFALMHQVARRIAIFLAIMFHLAIAVLMALPWFSLSMVAFDTIFVSTSTYIAFDGWIRARLSPVRDLFWDVVDPVVERVPGSRARARAS